MGDVNIFMILNYTTGRIISGLSSTEVCVVIRVLMQIDYGSFDIVSETYRGKEFCTADFEQGKEGAWIYNPKPKDYAAKDRD